MEVDGPVHERTFARLAVAALAALAFGGLVVAVGSFLGARFADKDVPGVHLGGQAAPEFHSLDDLLRAVERAGVSCPDPRDVEDPYASYAEDQIYPPTEALRCSANGSSLVLFLYQRSSDRIDVYEQAVIQAEACKGVREPNLDVAHSVAGANWRVTSVGSDQATLLVDYFDGQAVEEPLGCYPDY